jgi:excisionase family DNA binding protein
MNLADSLDRRTTALTMGEVTELLSTSQRLVYKLTASNRIPSFKIGGSIRFDPSTLSARLRGRMIPVPVLVIPPAPRRCCCCGETVHPLGATLTGSARVSK